ncbi:MAG: glycosyltransferase family 39 protein [Chloroflexi bacterium]|nr:glycosyltransferase family 39 protein [Chloroflexota bacterium]
MVPGLKTPSRLPLQTIAPAAITGAILLLFWWLTRLPDLQTLPLHNDEGLHLTRAVEVWNLHPFWEIRDGKIANHFLIALFYPQNAPVFAGRMATIFVALIGAAAGFALIRQRFGVLAGVLSLLALIASPYLLFYDRLALSDAEASALVVLSLWAADRLARRGTIANALLTGLCFGAAALFKFTAIPFALSLALVVLLTARYPVRRRLTLLVAAGLVTAALFVVPIGYLLLRGDDLFSIALGWIGTGGPAGQPALVENLARLWETLTAYAPVGTLLLIGGLILLPLSGGRGRGVQGVRSIPTAYLLALVIPLAVMLVLGREVLPRHFVVALPLALILSGAGWAALIDLLPMRSVSLRWGAALLVAALLIAPLIAALPVLWHTPHRLSMPAFDVAQFVTQHPSGYGLREAVLAMPDEVSSAGAPIIASMFPDSCRRANFYAAYRPDGLRLLCTDAPGEDAIRAALTDNVDEAVYVLTDTAPLIGADVPALAESLGAHAERVAAYPRPGESEQSASVVLWRMASETR